MSARPRIALLLASVIPFIGVMVGQVQPDRSWSLVVSGATKGYLSPCGCTAPMSGGIRRRTTLIRQISKPDDLVLEVGPFVGDLGRQMEIKAETLAQSMKVMGTDAIALQQSDFQIGEGVLETIGRLSGAQVLRGEATEVFESEKWRMASDPGQISVELAVVRARQFARGQIGANQAQIYVTHLGKLEAQTIAKAVPELDVVVYASSSNPDQQAQQFGKTWIVSPADQGRYVVSLQFSGEKFEAPAVYDLGPDVHDHEDVSRYYSQYLDRLRAEDLVQMMPKTSDVAYSGSKQCKSCHEREYAIWEKSKHNIAWETLKADGHDADPDCVGCHTTGIESTGGFLIEEKTPQLTDVGCESCHGASAAHVMTPKEAPLPKAGKESCMSCHKLQNSPNFKFETYWLKIKH